jgi:uncharacterized protein YndB with AHSA1/START domain
MAGEARISRSVEVRAAPEEVWRMLVDPEALSAWFGGTARLDVRPGGTGRLTDDDGEVRLAVVEEVEAPRRLVFSWWPLHRPDGTPPGPHDRSRVTITVEPDEAGGARIRVDEEALAVARRAVSVPVPGFPGRGAGTRPAGRARARACVTSPPAAARA